MEFLLGNFVIVFASVVVAEGGITIGSVEGEIWVPRFWILVFPGLWPIGTVLLALLKVSETEGILVADTLAC